MGTLSPAAPQGTTFHSAVATAFPEWLTQRASAGNAVSWPVTTALERFLRCNDPSAGYAVFGCAACGFELPLPLPCNGRAWCPTCMARRMRRSGDWMVHGIIGNAPVSHWVLCFPPQLKQTIGYDPKVLTAVLKCFVRKVFRYLRWKARAVLGVPLERSHPAAVTVIHFASCDLTPNTHFHCVVVDGVFVNDVDGNVYLRELTPPTVDDIAEVARLTCRAVCRMLRKRGLWRSTKSTRTLEEGVLLLGDEAPAKFFGDASYNMEGGAEPRKGAHPFHVWAGHQVEAGNYGGLRELVYYILAPVLWYDQVTIAPNGNIVLALKRPRHDGTNEVLFTPHEFLDALAELIPRKGKHTIRYHGAYAPNSGVRARAVPAGNDRPRPRRIGSPAEAATLRKVRARLPKDYFECPKCSMKLKLIELVTPRFRYQNPHWIKPDSPNGTHPAAIKTAASDTPTIETALEMHMN